ncbi:MAG TPA: antA/AntB antirepressor family protein, partial [Defluviitaleaceae bacterium]|nr:antA/AntB antirepressor family protein [Defluviitaleaceae bacterium]
MNELIKVNYSTEEPTVSARELHKFLEIATEFRHWFPRMCEYGFKEGIDYTPVIFDHPQNKQQ